LDCSVEGNEGNQTIIQTCAEIKAFGAPEERKNCPCSNLLRGAKEILEKFLASSTAPKSLKIFRLLIIGKTGCGKTTILSKVISIVCAFRKDVHSITGMRREYGK